MSTPPPDATAPALEPVKPPTAELLVVTGMSGAGRSTAANALEDLGWYVVDNLPPQMLGTLADLASRTPQTLPKLAVVIDVRGKALFNDMKETLAALETSGVEFSVLFLEASDEVLVSRYELQRRPHPLQAGGRILDGIRAERELLRDLRETADSVLDTTSFNVHGEEFECVDRFKLRQEVPGRATLLVQPAPGAQREELERFHQLMMNRAENQVELDLEVVDELPASTNGKFTLLDQRIPNAPTTWA